MKKYLEMSTETLLWLSPSCCFFLLIAVLGGVVVLEELQLANTKLSDSNTSPEDKIAILTRLKNKKPAKEILKSTGIGKTVHRLCRHENPAVAALSSEIYQVNFGKFGWFSSNHFGKFGRFLPVLEISCSSTSPSQTHRSGERRRNQTRQIKCQETG